MCLFVTWYTSSIRNREAWRCFRRLFLLDKRCRSLTRVVETPWSESKPLPQRSVFWQFNLYNLATKVFTRTVTVRAASKKVFEQTPLDLIASLNGKPGFGLGRSQPVYKSLRGRGNSHLLKTFFRRFDIVCEIHISDVTRERERSIGWSHASEPTIYCRVSLYLVVLLLCSWILRLWKKRFSGYSVNIFF